MSHEPENSSSQHPFEDPATAAIEQAAAEWLIARDRGWSGAQKRSFEHWLAADPRHAEMFSEMDETWERLDSLAAAVETGAPPGVSAGRSHRWMWACAGLAAAAAVVIAVLPTSRPHAGGDSVYAASASTDIGASRKLDLPDGSSIQLNTDTSLVVEYSAGERRVTQLRGEAFFQVAKDASRPFIVSGGGVAVRAVGTGFDVRMNRASVVVFVTEGKVRVSNASRGTTLLPVSTANTDEPPVLAAGQRVVVPFAPNGEPGATSPETIAREETEQALAWESGQLQFVDAPLTTIVDEFNRYNRHKLVITDPSLSTRRFGGTFATGDYDAFVHVLETQFGVVADRREAETALRAK